MKRLLTTAIIAVLIFAAGWLIGNAHSAARTNGVFRLAIDAPTGETTLRCEGCQFLTWADGRSGEPQPVFSFTCSHGPCLKAVGAVSAVAAPAPKLIARSNAQHALH